MAEVKIDRMVTKGLTGNTKAFFTVILGPVEVNDMRLVDGKNGLFIGFPSKRFEHKTEGTKYVPVVSLAVAEDGKRTKTSEDLYNKILKAATEEYKRREGVEAGVATTGIDEASDDLPF